MTSILAVVLACGIGGLLLWSFPERSAGGSLAVARVGVLVSSTGASNAVCSIVVGSRLFDTLFEILVYSVAVLGVRITLQGGGAEGSALTPSAMHELAESDVVCRSAYLLFPPVTLLGIYLAVFGHVSPGGGFSGGAVIASGLLLVAVAVGAQAVARRFHERMLERIEWGAVAVIFAIAAVSFLDGVLPRAGLFPAGNPGELIGSRTLLVYNLLIAIKVFLGGWVIIHFFIEHRGEI
ncbi:hypothetical protein JW848_04190 [Candidatus Bipolaricaulota bacterium]|nr:hypothetical protein [Candidatus Bipolaricaulota bacterium]